ncbi:MAG: ATP-binding cassette domain-containing protein [Hoeflea sp.]|uniref:ATP-binding cassette domain-containing protein n=1 Tax=Hoeflea sp. TaxID=1940281 RepID=UPI003298CA9F
MMMDKSVVRHSERLVRSEPLDLKSMTGAFYLVEGNVQIFLVEKPGHQGKPETGPGIAQGGRKFLFDVVAGGTVFGGNLKRAVSDNGEQVAFDASGLLNDGVTLVAVGGHDTEIIHFGDDTWTEDLIRAVGVSRLINGVDQWVDHLLDCAGTLLPRPEEFETLASPTHSDDLRAGALFSSRSGMTWVAQKGAPHLMFETIPLDQTSHVPVNDRSWYMAIETGPLVASTTGSLLQEGSIWACLEDFQTALLEFLPETLRLLAGDDVNRIKEFERRQTALSSDAFARLHGAVSGEVDEQAHVKGALPEDPLELVCAQLCRELNIDYQPVRSEVSSMLRERSLDEILDANSFRLREVKLARGWSCQDSGPLLFIDQTTGEPFALLPEKRSRLGRRSYWLYDPATREKRKLNHTDADALQGQAYMPYPPLSDEPLTAKAFVMRIFDNRLNDLLVILSVSIIGGILGLGVPIAVGFVIDEIIPSGDFGKLMELIAILVAVGTCIILCRYASQVATLRMEGWAGGRLEAGIIDRVLRLPITLLSSFSSGDLASRAMVVRSIEQVFTGALINSLLNSVFAVFSAALLFYYSVPLALIAIGFSLVVVALNFGLGYLGMHYQRLELNRSAQITGELFQTILGIEKIRLSASEVPRFHQWAGEYAKLTGNLIKSRQIQMASTISIQSAMIGGLMLIFGAIHFFDLNQNGMTTGTIAAFLAAFSNTMSGLLGLSGISLSLLALKPVLDHGRPILEASPESKNSGSAVEVLTGRVDLEQLCYSYPGTDRQVLNGVTASILPGQSVGIVGSSGSGKSTLVRLLLAFDEPDQGSVLYNGRALAGLDKNGVRRQIGVVLQDGRLMAGSLLDNIRGGNDQIAEEDAWEAAKHVALDADIRNMPMGMHTLIADKAALSGGQIQRLMIARALVNKPRILILDEATSALDNATQRVVSETLNHLGITRISIAHRISTIRNCDVVHVMDEGRIVESGDYDTLIANNGLFTELAARQSNA